MADPDDTMLPQQDRILFDNKTLEISDYMSSSVEKALKEGTKSLPRVPHEETLLELLNKTYSRNVAVLETYMGRNIFSIQSLPPTRRSKVVDAFLNQNLPNVPTVHGDNDKENAAATIYPTKDQIPSSTDMATMEQSLKSLRTQLADLKRRRSQLANTCQALSLVAIPEVPPEDISSTVTSLLHDKEVLQDLTSRAQDLVAQMDHEKKVRPIQDEGPAMPKKRKLGLEELYEKEKVIGSHEGLQKMRSLLQNK